MSHLRHTLALFTLLLLAGQMLAATDSKSPSFTLHLVDNNLLRGQPTNLGGSEKKTQLTWESPNLFEPITINLDTILAIQIPSSTTSNQPKDQLLTTIKLCNGDHFEGELKDITPDIFQLETAYAGTITLKKKFIQSVTFTPALNLLYQGPTDESGWIISKNLSKSPMWKISPPYLIANNSNANNTHLHAECSLARKIPNLTPAYHLSFKADWRANPSFSLFLQSPNDPTKTPKSYYKIQIDNQYLRAFRYISNKNPRLKSQRLISLQPAVPSSTIRNLESATFDLYVDNHKKSLTLYINQKFAATWNDPDPEKLPLGEWIKFSSTAATKRNPSSFALSQIKLSAWNQQLPVDLDPKKQTSPEIAYLKESPGQPIILQNNDLIIGEITSYKDEVVIKSASPTGTVSLPLDRIKFIRLSSSSTNRIRRQKDDIRAYFPNGKHLTFRLNALTPTTISGSSASFGTVEFQTQSFSHIEFNIWDETTIAPLLEKLHSPFPAKKSTSQN